MDHSTIRMLLLSAGWKEKEIAKALSSESLEMEVPTPPDVGGAREAFLHLLSFASLYTVVVSTIILYFQYINRLFPDAAQNVYSSEAGFSTIRSAMAASIVSFPLLLWMSKLIYKEIVTHAEKAWSGIRRWLTYLTLFIAATTLMVDVIILVFSLLEGELSARFLLKVLVVFAVAGVTFMYYFLSLKTAVSGLKSLNKKFLTIASVGVLIAIVWGAIIVGSPGEQRSKRFDDRRIEDLRAIQSEIFSIVYGDELRRPNGQEPEPVNPLPQSLQDMLEKAVYTYPDITDPETGEQYIYNIINEDRFELCAVFNHEVKEQYDIFWNHPAGPHCYEFNTAERIHY